MQKTSARLLALLSLLQTSRDWSGDELARRLVITSRTVRRDIDRLRELGYPITTVKGPAGAIRAREELRFDYTSDSSTPADDTRRVQPHQLVTWRHRWYLVAWDLHREDWRTFRVDRIRPRTPAGPRFNPRELPGGGDVSAFLTSRFRGNDGTTTDWPCQGEVTLHLPAADVAPYAHDAIVVERGPHHCQLVLGSWTWTGLAAAIGRFDTDIDVIGPPQLAAAFAELATRYARAAARTTQTDSLPAR